MKKKNSPKMSLKKKKNKMGENVEPAHQPAKKLRRTYTHEIEKCAWKQHESN
jgi:hypothetical protein